LKAKNNNNVVIKYAMKWINLSEIDIAMELSGKGITDNMVTIISQKKNITVKIIFTLNYT